MQRQIDRLVACQAAEWFERLKDGAQERNPEFIRWLTESPRHMEAFLSVTGEAPLMRKVFQSGAFDLATLMRNAKPAALDFPHSPSIPAKQTGIPGRRRNRGKLWAAAAALTAIASGAALYAHLSSWQRFETPVGEQRTVQLIEGSVINLNAHSRLDVKFDEVQRDIKLPRGEATFKVARDPARPFRVHTPGAMVEAVGTEFNVYARPDGTTSVAVLEGKVNVTSDRDGEASVVPLVAGEEAQVHPDGRIEREQTGSIAEAIAWQQRKLVFKRTALEDMAAEFNRYNKVAQIRLEGIERGEFRFSGAFNADDPQSLATVLSREAGLSVERRGEEIVIRAR